ncbi:hypothetical protein DL93DRAFT_2198497 [Clavulina sp. PMI_390]|nr:hypothetical protein DL93DRAFT_2198497 [Clavulina sp. PMI_390]
MASQPPGHGDELPTYDALAAAEADLPNSRFGRWRDWVEKRANERAFGSTPEQKLKRRARGWGNGSLSVPPPPPPISAAPSSFQPQPNYSETLPSSIPYTEYEDTPLKRLSVGERIPQSHVSIHHFGSRFIPHADCQIHAVLPVMADRYLLLGTDDGLAVLDLLPSLHGGATGHNAGRGHLMNLGDAKPRKLWVGESIYQLSLLEVAKPNYDDDDDDGRSTTSMRGVILALVGVNSRGSEDQKRTVRMYSLSSICSLITFSVNQPESAKPLNLSVNATLQTPAKKVHSRSISRGLRSLLISDHSSHAAKSEPQSAITPSSSSQLDRSSSTLTRAATEEGWDLIEELPMRWATDFVPLAPASGKTPTIDVNRFELYHSNGTFGRAGSLLALAAKSSILIFEAPQGERAFRFVKDLYTPFPVTHLRFVEHAISKSLLTRHSEKSSPRRSGTHESRRSMRGSLQLKPQDVEAPILVGANSHLALFVSFEKRAAIIRLSDSSVQEVTLYKDPALTSVTASSQDNLHFGHGHGRRSSSEGFAHISPGVWLPTVSLTLPPPPPVLSPDDREVLTLQTINILTKGKTTHIVRSPLPAQLSTTMPLVELTWRHAPSSLSARVVADHQNRELPGSAPWEGVVQLLGFGPAGVEVLEIPVSSIRTRAAQAANTARLPVDTGVDLLASELPDTPRTAPLSYSSPSSSTPTPMSAGYPDLNQYRPMTPNSPGDGAEDMGNQTSESPIATQSIISLSLTDEFGATTTNPALMRPGEDVKGKGKGKAKTLPIPPWESPEPVRGYIDIGSDTTFLCTGGRWHDMLEDGHLSPSHMQRARATGRTSALGGTWGGDDRASATFSREDDYDWDRESEYGSRIPQEDTTLQGVYACTYRGPGDFRVFYVGDYVEGDQEAD